MATFFMMGKEGAPRLPRRAKRSGMEIKMTVRTERAEYGAGLPGKDSEGRVISLDREKQHILREGRQEG